MKLDIDPDRLFSWQHEFPLPDSFAPPACVYHPFILDLHEKLVSPLRSMRNLDCYLKNLHLLWVEPGSPELEAALSLVSYSYGMRYIRDQHNLTDADLTIGPAHGSNSRVLLALQECGDLLLPVGTLTSAVGTDLDLFELFEMSPDGTWPHEQESGSAIPGELCRFGMHPVFDLLDGSSDSGTRRLVDFYRRLILRKLTGHSLDPMVENNTNIAYCAVGPHILYFMRRCGMNVIRVPHARPRDTAEVRNLRSRFARYWRPEDAPTLQPLPYQLTGRIAPISELPDLPVGVRS